MRYALILLLAGLVPVAAVSKGKPGGELNMSVGERKQFQDALRLAGLPATTRPISIGTVTPQMPFICVRSIVKPKDCRYLALQTGTFSKMVGADDIRWDSANNRIELPVSLQPPETLHFSPYAGLLYAEAPKARTLVSCDLSVADAIIEWRRTNEFAGDFAKTDGATFAFYTPASANSGGNTDLRFSIKKEGATLVNLLGCRFWQLGAD